MGALDHHSLELTGLAGDPASPVHRLDPRAKIVAFLGVTVIAVTVSLEEWPVWLACATVLVTIAWMAGIGAGAIWRRAHIVLPLVLLVAVFVPLVRSGGASYEVGPLILHQAGLEIFAAVAIKATIGITSAVLLGMTTSFPMTLRGLEALRVPRLLTLIAGLMYRYLFVIGGEAARMRDALLARGYRPRGALRVGAMGRVATARFLRSYSRGERVHMAMLSRGYSAGRMPQPDELVLVRADLLFAGGILVGLVVARLAVADL